MSKLILIALALALSLPAMAYAEFVPSDHRWTIGYEEGITVRRFLGESWEVYLGGGPRYYTSASETQYLDDPSNENSFSDSISQSAYQDKGGKIFFGVGRSLLREDRFWLAGLINLRHYWSNSSSSDNVEYTNEPGEAEKGNVGHSWSTTVHFGLRPALDITRRITIMVEMGISFSHYSSTKDYWSENPDHINWWDNDSQRNANSNTSVDLYGYSGINSIRMMFRF